MKVIRALKRSLYFWFAGYFAFWARIYLKRWQPTIVTVIGSSGKTTILHLLEAELGNEARYSHKANSAFGIPFNILGLERSTFKIQEWFWLIVAAPFKAFRIVEPTNLYITEADAERPGEGKLLADVLKPAIVIWLSLEEAHGINYDQLVNTTEGDYRNAVRNAMAHEFGNFLEQATNTVIINGDNHYIKAEAARTKAHIITVHEQDINSFIVGAHGVTITTQQGMYKLPALVPPQAALSVLAVIKVVETLGKTLDPKFKTFTLPPSRSSVLAGKHNTVLIDSSYNATIDGVRSMLDLMTQYPATGPKWLVLGDMIEQGKSEALEHTDLAEFIKLVRPQRVVLVGPRLRKYTYPLLQPDMNSAVASYEMPAEALADLERNIKGGETILFKGARYLEGVVERLLANPNDAAKLCRREQVWVERRKQWGI